MGTMIEVYLVISATVLSLFFFATFVIRLMVDRKQRCFNCRNWNRDPADWLGEDVFNRCDLLGTTTSRTETCGGWKDAWEKP